VSRRGCRRAWGGCERHVRRRPRLEAAGVMVSTLVVTLPSRLIYYGDNDVKLIIVEYRLVGVKQ
jgi:hypothetical protein